MTGYFESAIAAGDNVVLQKASNTAKYCFEELLITADAVGTVTITDGVSTRVLNVREGFNKTCFAFRWTGGAGLTFTAATANVNLYLNYHTRD